MRDMDSALSTVPPDPLSRLNDAQRAAVLHGDGDVAPPLLVIAGAGTGKTNTLVHRLAHLVSSGADPRRILVMTFSRRAAAEMTRRAERIAAEVLGPRAAVLAEGLIWTGTFHAIGARLLREQATAVGLDPAFTIHDREDSADLMALARHRLGLTATERRFPAKGTCLAIYSRTVNARADLGDVLRRHFPWCAEWEAVLRQLFAAYVAAKQESAVLDYDDLLLLWAAMMQEPAIAAEIGGRFDHVLVDEYQDTNLLQAAILLALKPDGRGVTVVGDDAQSIYAFRAAEVRNILDFPGHFTPRARVVALEQNYRSTPEILAAANAVIAEAGEGYLKSLRSDRPAGPPPSLVAVRDESGQVDYVCRQVLEAREAGTALKKQAVLFRTASHSGPLEVELVRRNIPFVKFGGLKFLDSAHVKDVLACLRFAQNPADRIAGFRVLQLIPGVGAATAEALLDAARGGAAAPPVPRRAAADWAAFAALLDGLRAARRLAGRTLGDPGVVRAPPRAPARGRGRPVRRPPAARGDRRDLPRPRALSHRDHPRPAGGEQRPRRRAPSRRGLPDPLDDPLGQGAGVDQRLRAQLRGRLHPVGPRHRHQRRDRRGAPAALRRDDEGPRDAPPRRAAALPRPRPAQERRPPRLCDAHPLHPDRHPRPLRALRLARRPRRGGGVRSARPTGRPSTSVPACGRCGSRLAPPVALGVAALADAALRELAARRPLAACAAGSAAAGPRPRAARRAGRR